MSVVLYDLQSDEKTNRTRQKTGADSPTDTRQQTAERPILKKIRTKDICTLAHQLATLLRAGMPLVPALSVLVEQLQATSENNIKYFRSHENPLAKIMKQVVDNVTAGSTLADALKKHPNAFSSLFVNMVAAGEMGGTLEQVLMQLAQILQKRVNLMGKVKSAIAYPIMMLVVAVGVVVFLLSFVVPSITEIFVEMNRSLPWPTRMLIATSSFIRTYLLLIVIIICAGCFAIGLWIRTKEGRMFADRSKLKLPLFGKLFLKLEISRLTRTLGALLASGVPILSALEVTKKVIQNSFIADALNSVKDLVSKGDNIANAIRKTGLFPPIVFHILATGQISGKIEDGLIDIAEMYDSEVERLSKTLVSLLEPVILLAMGVIIGFIVLAVLLPIFEIDPVS